jgi:light-regulated signal transduction histidine kinase (bacteriophytochrome)
MKRHAHALDDAGREYLEKVLNSASRMRQSLRDLLAFSLAASRPKTFEQVNLRHVAKEAAAVFEVEIKDAGAHVDIGEMPLLEADKNQMLQLFQNLIGNALKYRSDRAPQISVHAEHTHGGSWDIHVSDNGIGFDQVYAERIFKPFQRLHGRNQYEGIGMGLTICRKIVERHGGTIRAESEPGKGSTFIIRLPEKQAGLEFIGAGKQS